MKKQSTRTIAGIIYTPVILLLIIGVLPMLFAPVATAAVQCTNTITANVVVLDNPTVFNRLGAQNPNWITYALERDVVHATGPQGQQPPQPAGTPCRLPDGTTTGCAAGLVELRPDKRTRPLVVRSVAGSCLEVNFTNLLDPTANPNDVQQGPAQGEPGALFNDDQVASRCAGFHASGTELVNDMADDGSMVGNNHPGADVENNCAAGDIKGGLVGPGQTITYDLYTPHEGAYIINSYGATIGAEASGGNLGVGMLGGLFVQPPGSKMYRGQVTEEEMRLTSMDLDPASSTCGQVNTTDLGQPIIDYEALYPAVDCDAVADGGTGVDLGAAAWVAEGKAGLPILNMLTAANELVHSDINAIIAGSCDGEYEGSWECTKNTENAPYPLEKAGYNNPQLPNRLEPFREFASIWHDEQTNAQVFPEWYSDPVLGHTLHPVGDAFMINYGSGGIGSEIIANRLHTGPMHDCANCAYEEFFLASQTVGDPGMLVNNPANTGIEACDPSNILSPDCWRQFMIDADVNGDGVIDPGGEAVGANPPIEGNFSLFPADPANLHHAYVGDRVKIRNIHAGAFEQHIFHLHNHQWLFNPEDDNANYLDAQEIMPGSGHTYELVNGGAGNRNKTAGDAIFHCHFYPHFAQGMWYHIRIKDVFEKGTVLAVSNADDAHNPTTGFHTQAYALRNGTPEPGARAQPDGELAEGTPIPAIVPLPGKPMPLMPAKVEVVEVDRGDFGVLSGRRPAGGVLGQGPDSGQAVVKIHCDPMVMVDGVNDCADAVAGLDGVLHTDDDLNPGFPFWLAGNSCGVPIADDPTTPNINEFDPCPEGIVGQRMPTPPLDMLTVAGAVANGFDEDQAGGWDGGLPRHALRGYTSGGVSLDTQNRLDFRKIVEIAQPVYFPEVGTDLEKVAMAYHGVRERPSKANKLIGTDITTGDFVLNGAPAVPGGPFQDPCIDDVGTYLADGVVGEWFDGDGDPTTFNTRGGSEFSGDSPRTYKLANVQIDAVFNKVGHHYSQERIIALWEDVAPTIAKQRPPEPLVMRFNTFDCGKLLHTNLVPAEFELDDFQVRTPTDIIGQHIHLPKWDLTTNDGAANGWNYEDGSLAPKIVEERIKAINNFNALAGADTNLVVILTEILGLPADKFQPDLLAAIGGHQVNLTDLAPVPTIDTGDPGSSVHAGETTLHAKPHPFFGHGPGGGDCESENPGDYCGARTVIQRFLMDPVVNVAGVDRGLGLTFSHDHYGPSTFQQIGLYSTILAEPAGSTWKHNESGEDLFTRHDGGPTTWQAAIITPNEEVQGNTTQSHLVSDHREFYFEMSDFQHAYNPGVYVGAGPDGRPKLTEIVQPEYFNATVADAPALNDTWQQAVNPPLKLEAGGGFPDVVTANGGCPGPLGKNDANVPRPCAEAINISHSSTWVVNYRNEPVGLRVFDPNRTGPDGQNGAQAAGRAGDLAFAFHSNTNRAIPQLNTSVGDTPYPTNPGYCQGANGDFINCDRRPGDPFTPIMRAYERDDVKIKIQVGATEEQHQATVHGVKWLSNGSAFGRSPNSGWRAFQSTGISEQFSLQVPMNPDPQQAGATVDYLYATDATRDGMWLGTWGVLRSYGQVRQDLIELPDNPQGNVQVVNQDEFRGVCPLEARGGQGGGGGPRGPANLVPYDVVAVLANDVLPNNLGVTIPGNQPVNGLNDNAGGPLDPAGGTLVYNRRGSEVKADMLRGLPGGFGPLNDPTAMMYVPKDDLVFDSSQCGGESQPACRTIFGNPVGLQPGVPVEPLVLRANAGDCIEVTLHNALPDVAPDLAGWQDLLPAVTRRVEGAGTAAQMYFFNNNLIRPSSYVGLHSQLVANDASRDDGVLVGQNNPGLVLASPGGKKTYRWYAGDLSLKPVTGGNPNQRRFEIVATPIEFGATNLLSADRVKQPQKGLFGALSILPPGSTVSEDTQVPDGQGSGAATRLTRAQVSVTSPAGDAGDGGNFRENLLIGHKIGNMRWKNGSAIRNIEQANLGVEGAEDSGHAGFNYAAEPAWFRFGLNPDAPFGNAGTPNSYGSLPNAHAMYANGLVAGETNSIPAIPGVSAAGDPVTPVFRVTADTEGTNPVTDTRIHVLNGASADRDGTFILHGHLWQRDPYVCPGQDDGMYALPGRCNQGGDPYDPMAPYVPVDPLGSLALGDNPQGKWMGGEEGMGHVYGYWPILFDAGGTGAVKGDYLYRDYSPSGNRNGQFGILRVE